MKRILVSLGLLLCMNVAFATPAPVELLQKTSNGLISSLEKHQSKLESQPVFVNGIVREKLVPIVDIDEMASQVLGRYRRQAKGEKWAQFKKAFVKLVIQNYAAPLADYNGDKVEFLPVRGFKPTTSRATITSIIIRPNGQRIPLSYKFVREGDTWRVIDFSVDGISMVESYRSQFASLLAQKGFDGLLARLQRSPA